MDFPLAPHTIRKVENKADHGGEDVVVYDRGIKNVHQDFVIVFAVTFAVIVVLIVSVVITFHTIKKCNSVINQRKQVPNLCVTTEAGTIIYEKAGSVTEIIRTFLIDLTLFVVGLKIYLR